MFVCVLFQVEEEFVRAIEKKCPVAAVIIEPIQAEGGGCVQVGVV